MKIDFGISFSENENFHKFGNLKIRNHTKTRVLLVCFVRYKNTENEKNGKFLKNLRKIDPKILKPVNPELLNPSLSIPQSDPLCHPLKSSNFQCWLSEARRRPVGILSGPAV